MMQTIRSSQQVEDPTVLVRAANPVVASLLAHLFLRYPKAENVTLAEVGWRATPVGLILTLRALQLPQEGDLDLSVANARLLEPYFLRQALAVEYSGFGIGVIHSHPEGYRTYASAIDDEMDEYFASFFAGFTPNRPYVSLIFAKDKHGRLSGTGRVWWKGEWHRVERFAFEDQHVSIAGYQQPKLPKSKEASVSRLTGAFGEVAAARLHGATITVVGAGGTGSVALEVLARAGVGHIVAIDSDTFSSSNLERVHGSEAADLDVAITKMQIVRRHLGSIRPDLGLTTITGRMPQAVAIDWLARSDFVIGCTDSHSARVAISDASKRYLVPGIDVGVTFEGVGGRISAQLLQLARLNPEDACAYCREIVVSQLVTQELMTPEEVARRMAEAEIASAAGRNPNPYWRNTPQLNTVGYLTTAAGALAAGYAIGKITGAFLPPFELLQADLSKPDWMVVNRPRLAGTKCRCDSLFGAADQGAEGPLIVAPSHWTEPIIVTVGHP